MLFKFILMMLLFCFSLLGHSQNNNENDSISNELKEVLISGKKQMFSNKNGNIKIDVANSIYNTSSNTLDLLAKMPSVQISPDKEKITVVGKGTPLVYIDNQRAELNDLNVLAVTDIKSIEIIQNPSAKYEAEGRTVILIERKFAKKDSFQTVISEVASFKKNYNNYVGFNSNFKKNKLELKANFNYNPLEPWESHRMMYQIPAAGIQSNYDVSAFTKRVQFIFGAGAFYKISETAYFSAAVNSKLQKDKFDINTHTFNQHNAEVNQVVTFSDNSNKKNFVNTFLNYNKKLKEIDAQVFTGIQYSNFDQGLWSNVENDYNNTEFVKEQYRSQEMNVGVFTGRMDFEKKWKKDLKFEMGGLYLVAKSTSDFDVLDLVNHSEVLTHYDFKEQNVAGYAQVSGKLRKMDFLIGIRAENTNVQGQFKTEVIPLISKKYTNYFPKVQFSFPLDSISILSFNYAKNIQRPNYSALSQGTTYINPYFLYGRNSNLDPTFTNEISATLQIQDKSIKVSCYQNKNPVYNSFKYDEQQNVLMLQDVNFKKESGFSIDIEFPFNYKGWSSTNSLVLTSNKIEAANAVFQGTKPYLYFYSSQDFKLPKQYVVAFTMWGMTKQKEGVFERNARFISNVSIGKTFKNWNCTLSYNDIFKNSIYKEVLLMNSIDSKSRYLVDSNEIAIALRYTFGSVKATEYKVKDVDENANRIR